jgi:endonuclease YncB( thermonuclease family)
LVEEAILVARFTRRSNAKRTFGGRAAFAVCMATTTAAILLPAAGPTMSAEYSGTVGHIRDGDTFAVCDATMCTMVRICGIDTPERGEAGADAATAALVGLIEGRDLRCVQVGGGTPCDGRSAATNGDRIVAQCFADGVDIAEPLVERGFACDWIRFSGGHYSGGHPDRRCPR